MQQSLIEEKLESHEEILNEHGQRLNKIETHDAVTDVNVSNLCTQLGQFTKILFWTLTTYAITLIGLVVWCVQMLSTK